MTFSGSNARQGTSGRHTTFQLPTCWHKHSVKEMHVCLQEACFGMEEHIPDEPLAAFVTVSTAYNDLAQRVMFQHASLHCTFLAGSSQMPHRVVFDQAGQTGGVFAFGFSASSVAFRELGTVALDLNFCAPTSRPSLQIMQTMCCNLAVSQLSACLDCFFQVCNSSCDM